MALIGTVTSETSAGIRALADLTVDPGTIAAGAGSFTVNLPPQFVNGYPVACVPLSQTKIDGASVSLAAGMSIVSTSLSNGVLTVNTENTGSASDPGSLRFLFVQFCGEN